MKEQEEQDQAFSRVCAGLEKNVATKREAYKENPEDTELVSDLAIAMWYRDAAAKLRREGFTGNITDEITRQCKEDHVICEVLAYFVDIIDERHC